MGGVPRFDSGKPKKSPARWYPSEVNLTGGAHKPMVDISMSMVYG